MGWGTKSATRHESPTTDRGLFGTPDFLVPYLAETQSVAGDQVGRVALSILVFDRTASVAWTALTYALTFLPGIFGGFVLGGIGDRFPQVWVMVGTDLLRAVLFAAMAIPAVPLPVVVVLVAAAFFLGPTFSSAMVSRLAATLAPEDFRSASGIRMITSQLAQVGGFGLGGVVVAFLHPHGALAVDAATFAFSAAFIATFLRGRRPGLSVAEMDRVASGPTATDVVPRDPDASAEPDSGPPRLLRDPWLRHLILLTALAGFFVVPEGLAVPVAHDLGASVEIAGLFLAAAPLGGAIGAALLVRLGSGRNRMQRAELMALGCGVPLLAVLLAPAWPVVVLLFAASGALWAYQVEVVTAFVHAVDERFRSASVARASAILLGAQGLGLAVFGVVGDLLGPTWGVGLAGATGIVIASAIVLRSPVRRAAR